MRRVLASKPQKAASMCRHVRGDVIGEKLDRFFRHAGYPSIEVSKTNHSEQKITHCPMRLDWGLACDEVGCTEVHCRR